MSGDAGVCARRRRRLALLQLCSFVLLAAPAAAEPPLQQLARLVGEGQGVYAIAGDGAPLVAQAEDRAVHPASVTKIATSLALLEQLGPTYRFETRVSGTGPLRKEHVEGDLVVEGGNDPFLIDESAVRIAQRLRARGVRVVDGRLVTRGRVLFDWQPDPAGRRLQAVLTGTAAPAVWRALVAGEDSAADPRDAALVFMGRPTSPAAGGSLVVYRSPPLLRLLKVLNGYSNNVFHFAADTIGGAAAVQASAERHVPAALHGEIVIENGAGAGTTNRLSPRAVVALLDALAREVGKSGHDLTAVLPVSGLDPGTLEARLDDQRGVVVGKTGTFGSVGASAFVGALTTRERGVVRFAVLNHGVPVPDARARQDAFVRALITATGARPWAYVPATTAPDREAQID